MPTFKSECCSRSWTDLKSANFREFWFAPPDFFSYSVFELHDSQRQDNQSITHVDLRPLGRLGHGCLCLCICCSYKYYTSIIFWCTVLAISHYISLLAIQSSCVDASELLHAPVMPSLQMVTTGDELNEAHARAHFEAGSIIFQCV